MSDGRVPAVLLVDECAEYLLPDPGGALGDVLARTFPWLVARYTYIAGHPSTWGWSDSEVGLEDPDRLPGVSYLAGLASSRYPVLIYRVLCPPSYLEADTQFGTGYNRRDLVVLDWDDVERPDEGVSQSDLLG